MSQEPRGTLCNKKDSKIYILNNDLLERLRKYGHFRNVWMIFLFWACRSSLENKTACISTSQNVDWFLVTVHKLCRAVYFKLFIGSWGIISKTCTVPRTQRNYGIKRTLNSEFSAVFVWLLTICMTIFYI